jgi:serine/threonine-protein kinase
MGEVWLAIDENLDRRVALKLLPVELAADHGFPTRFLAESRLAASLDHPHIVPIYEAGEADDRLFIAMRYVEGADLGTLIERGGPLDPARAVTLLRGVADALDAAHDRGLVHRDVKPGNILVAPTARGGEHAYLADFGLTKQLGSGGDFTRSGQVLGSLGYIAPEQIEGRPIDSRADVYSLACVLYEALTGRPPFPGERDVATLWAHLQSARPRPSGIRPELAAFDPIIARGMAIEPLERYPSAGELIAVAAAAAGSAQTNVARGPADGLPSLSTTRDRASGNRVIAVIAAILAIGLVVVAVVSRLAVSSAVPSSAPVAAGSGVASPSAPPPSADPRSSGISAVPSPSATTDDVGLLAFETEGDAEQADQYVVSLDRGAPVRVARGAAGGTAISPDATLVAYRGDDGRLWVTTAAGQNSRPLFPPGSGNVAAAEGSAPSWSPDGRFIAFVRGASVWILELSSGQLHKVVDLDTSSGATLGNPAWSPDGRQMLVDRFGNGPADSGIWLVDSTCAMTRLIDEPRRYEGDAAWSPDGAMFAFTSSGETYGDSDNYVLGVNGAGLRPLDAHPAIDLSPAWSPDGSAIAFVSERQFRRQIFIESVANATVNAVPLPGVADPPTYLTWSSSSTSNVDPGVSASVRAWTKASCKLPDL